MLKMSSTIPMLGCFSFLVVMTVSPALCEHDLYNRSVPPTAIPLSNNTRGRRSAEDTGYLVGDTTPVWVIHNQGPDSAWQYIKQRDRLIQDAINDWRVTKPKSRYSLILQTDGTNWNGRSDPITGEENLDMTVSSTKRDLHVVIAMLYPGYWPTKQDEVSDDEQIIKKRVLYAVAFWNAIHMRLKKTRNPTLRIRIDGIAIVRPRPDENVTFSQLLQSTFIHSQALIPKNENGVPVDEVDRVMFTMTGMQRPEGQKHWNIETRVLPGIRVDPGNSLPTQLIGVVYDDLIFGALKKFPINDTYFITNLRELSRLPQFTPASYIQHGNPIRNPPMPGQVLTLNKQCEHHGYKANNRVSRNFNWCKHLVCKADYLLFISTIPNTEIVAADGTYCDDSKVCMDLKCVTKTRNTFAYSDEPLDPNEIV